MVHVTKIKPMYESSILHEEHGTTILSSVVEMSYFKLRENETRDEVETLEADVRMSGGGRPSLLNERADSHMF